MIRRFKKSLLIVLIGMLLPGVMPALGEMKSDNFSAPKQLSTTLGTLEFDAGRPSPESVRKLYDYLDLSRAVKVYLDNIPAVSTEAIRREHIRLGATTANHLLITEQMADAKMKWLTGNTETVYIFAFLDLKRDGATVIEIPAGIGPGLIDDAWMRWVVDMGPIGLDRGRGGTYVLLPPDYQGPLDPPVGGMKTKMKIGKVEKEVIAVKSPTYCNWWGLRGFLVNGKPDAAVRLFKEGVKIYPLKDAANPPAMRFTNLSRQQSDTIFPNNSQYFAMLNEVVQREPLSAIDLETRGLLSAIGIEKGNPYKPDPRWQKILAEAARIGDATGRAIFYAPRDPESYFYPDRQWFAAFIGNSYNWLKDKGRGGRNLDARTLYFYCAIANTPAMTIKIIGKGSQYAIAARDSQGDYLDGGKNYRLHIPPKAPVTHFWSIVLYDSQSRCLLDNGQEFPAKTSARDQLKKNADGSVDLYFGPKPPAGKENNWIKTRPGQGWLAVLRLYGPLEPWFDKSWKPGDFELLKK